MAARLAVPSMPSISPMAWPRAASRLCNSRRSERDRPASSVGQAVLHSARFPFVTPAGAYREAAWAQGKLVPRLVDGGYADNSGATTLAGLRPTGRPWLVNVDGNPAPVAGCEKEAQRRPPIITAVRGLLQARTAHADHALASLQGAADGEVTASNGRAVNIVFDLARVYGVPVPGAPEQTAPACQQIARAQQPPLGWYMSYEAAVLLVHSARVGAMDLCQKLNLHCRSMLPLPPLPQ